MVLGLQNFKSRFGNALTCFRRVPVKKGVSQTYEYFLRVPAVRIIEFGVFTRVPYLGKLPFNVAVRDLFMILAHGCLPPA